MLPSWKAVLPSTLDSYNYIYFLLIFIGDKKWSAVSDQDLKSEMG